MIKNLIEQQTSRVVVKDEMLKHMIGYSKLSSVLWNINFYDYTW